MLEYILFPPQGYTALGKRENNEDGIFPPAEAATAKQRLFVVCDGVGGASRGEAASQLVSESVADYFKKHPVSVAQTDYMEAAFAHAQKALDEYLEENPSAQGMGTTLTLLFLHEAGATIMHCGDSRIYRITPTHFWHTEDHSLVNKLLKAGVITPQEAATHPQRNVITQALQGASVSEAKPEVHTFTNLKAGDLFFLCTDGVLEAWENEALRKLLQSPKSLAEKAKTLQATCEEKSRDNFSFYLVGLREVKGELSPYFKQLAETEEAEEEVIARSASYEEGEEEGEILTAEQDEAPQVPSSEAQTTSPEKPKPHSEKTPEAKSPKAPPKKTPTQNPPEKLSENLLDKVGRKFGKWLKGE